MEIVIDIPEKTYKYYNTLSAKGEVLGFAERAIMLGTPLPKHHGRLIDADDLYENTEICHSDIDGYACVRWKDINDAPTIIEESDSE